MKDWLTKDLKTTLAGLAAGALNAYANGMSLKQIGVSLGLVLLGKLAGDSGQPQPAEK